MAKYSRKDIKFRTREMIAKVYHFLKEEYEFMKLCNTDNCNLKPLLSIVYRTAKATGVCVRNVSDVLKENRKRKDPIENTIKEIETKNVEAVESEDEDDRPIKRKRKVKLRRKQKKKTLRPSKKCPVKKRKYVDGGIMRDIKQEEIEIEFSASAVDHEQNQLPASSNESLRKSNNLSGKGDEYLLNSSHKYFKKQNNQTKDNIIKSIKQEKIEIEYLDLSMDQAEKEVTSPNEYMSTESNDLKYDILTNIKQELEIEYCDSSSN